MDRRPAQSGTVRKMELLAPAGTIGAFEAAVESGADAVYLGAPAFNARALARHFSLAELAAMIDHAHRHRVRVYLAMNSLMKEAECKKAVKTLAAIAALEADALIVQDLGIYALARRFFPQIRLHASTLMGAHNSINVQQLAGMGFSRVVLARELSLAEIGMIHRQSPVELEVFVHGALCFAYSGLCLFSSFLGGKSGLRGRCVQPCRRRYSWGGGGRGDGVSAGYLFSMSDLSGLKFLPELAAAGVASLKIEGRMRSAQYVASVVRAYRLALDHPNDPAKLAEASELIDRAMGRKTTPGYFTGARPAGIISPQHSGNTGLFLGKIEKVGPERVQLSLKAPLALGDRLRLHQEESGERQGFSLKGLWQGAKALVRAEAGARVQLSLPPGAKIGDSLYKVDTTERIDRRTALAIRPARFVSKAASLVDPALLARIDRALKSPVRAPAAGAPPLLPARKREGSVKVVQVAALGGAEPPGCGSFSAGILPASEVSAASRASLRPAADKPAASRRPGPVIRDSTLTLPCRRREERSPKGGGQGRRGRGGGGKTSLRLPLPWWLKIDNLDLLRLSLPVLPSRLLITLSKESFAQLDRYRKRLRPYLPNLVWSLPPVIVEADLPFYREAIERLCAEGFLLWQIAHLGQRLLFTDLDSGPIRLFADYPLNILNSQSLALLAGQGIESAQLAIESDRGNIFEILGRKRPIPLGLTVYGRPPLFTARLDCGFFQYDRPLVSPKGEVIFLTRRFGQTLAVADQPFSLMAKLTELAGQGLAYAVVDLSCFQVRSEELAAIFSEPRPGRKRRQSTFNYSGELL